MAHDACTWGVWTAASHLGRQEVAAETIRDGREDGHERALARLWCEQRDDDADRHAAQSGELERQVWGIVFRCGACWGIGCRVELGCRACAFLRSNPNVAEISPKYNLSLT